MDIRQNVSLKDYSTMRLGGTAAYLLEVYDNQDVIDAVAWAQERGLPVLMIGGGSNIVWRDEGFPGLILVNKIMGFNAEPDGDFVRVHIGAGENWDSVVERTVQQDLTGIEALSLIPGTAGATPVQNVGAYGQEIAQTLESVRAYDRETGQMVAIPGNECAFGYRTSRFKTTDRGRFFITGISLRLKRGSPQPPFYEVLQRYLDDNKITDYTPQTIRDAVIAIRRSKLPDPAFVANNGSFFANPIISHIQLLQLQTKYLTIPFWHTDDGRIKIPAAWLLEKAGFKNTHDRKTGMATWHKQPLVLVNEHAESTAQLLEFRQKILDAVQKKFGITLVQEPELLP